MKLTEFPVRHHYATINGVQLHFVEAGPASGAPLVVLLHGFPEMWWCWRHQILPLSQAGFRVVVPDLRGYNDSEKQGPYDLFTLATDIRELIRSLGEASASVVGHDWGGAITWQLAAQYPEVCRKIAVLNCPYPAKLLKALRSNPRQIAKSWYVFAFQIPGLPERAIQRARGPLLKTLYRRSAVDQTHFGDEEIAPLIEALGKQGAAHAAVEYYRTSIREALRRPQSPSREAAARISCPALLIWAKKDIALDYDALVPGTDKYVEDLRIEPIEDCGHFVQEEQPEKVNELLLGFL